MNTPNTTLRETNSGVVDIDGLPVSPSFAQQIVKDRWWKDQERFILYAVIVTIVSCGSLFGILYYPSNCALTNALFSTLNLSIGSVIGLVVSHVRKKK